MEYDFNPKFGPNRVWNDICNVSGKVNDNLTLNHLYGNIVKEI